MCGLLSLVIVAGWAVLRANAVVPCMKGGHVRRTCGACCGGRERVMGSSYLACRTYNAVNKGPSTVVAILSWSRCVAKQVDRIS